MKRLRALSVLLLTAMSVPVASATGTAVAAPRLVDVRASHHPGFDRVVFEFEGGLPDSVSAGFVPRLIADGSGLPVRIAGRGILEVSFRSTQTDRGTPAPRRRAFALPNVMTVVRSGLFEGVTTYGIGVARKGAFQVHKEPEMNRVVVDVHATFDTVERRVYFFDVDRFQANREPFFVSRFRQVPVDNPATGVLDRLFAGPLPQERGNGLRLLRSHAKDFADLSIDGQIARVRLVRGCSSGGSTVTVAGEIVPSLRQFDTVDWVKILDPDGQTADPLGPGDSIPDCLNP